MSNIGKKITDFYCNGFFGRNYDMENSVIIAEGDGWIVVKKEDGEIDFAKGMDQEAIDRWCEEKEDDGPVAPFIYEKS